MRIITRGGLIRLGVLALALALLAFWGWTVMFRMPGRSHHGPLPPLSGEEAALRDALRRHVEQLAGEIGERNVFRPEKLERAAAYVQAELEGAGYRPTLDEYPLASIRARSRNISADIPGRESPGEIILLGAHYDSVEGSPGANDNATGVAALLEMARALRGQPRKRTLRFVAFVNEEPPFFQTPEMGSLVYARAARARGDRIVIMIALETMGYYRDEPGTQTYPRPLGAIYPDTADFIGFVGNVGSRQEVKKCVRLFREEARFPSEGGATLGAIPGVGWSDHWAFWEAGYRALMVTDTAPFRYPHYHRSTDTPDKIDHERLARVVAGLIRVVARLASE